MLKKVTLYVWNSELNALEDLLFCKLKKKEMSKAVRLSKALWGKLVKARR